MGARLNPLEQAQAQVAFAARAVEAHYELVAALRAIVNAVDTNPTFSVGPDDTEINNARQALDRVRAARTRVTDVTAGRSWFEERL